ncbi:MAG TPA: Rieske (2Fe-2S) protein [Xanthobacteraceae bacterium]|nr:Rieske (2Fe-2S) protein [Xanthobacteraceae bacterium]
MARHVVATVGEIAPGASKLVTVKGREISLFNVKGEYFALANKCPHEGASLCRGTLVGLAESDGPGDYRVTRQGEFLKCPWHGWEFDVRTGQSWCDPGNTYVRQFAVSVEPGGELLKGPYVLETFQVAVDENYIVVEM